MRITYQSKKYDPLNVTGRYVRVMGSKRSGYMFTVFETESGIRGPGRGCTLREYVTTGEELPEELKAQAIKNKTTCLWDNPNG